MTNSFIRQSKDVSHHRRRGLAGRAGPSVPLIVAQASTTSSVRPTQWGTETMRDGGFASIDVISAIDSAPISQRQLFTFVLCALIALIDGFDTQAIAFVAPAISEQWHLDGAAFGPVFERVSPALHPVLSC
ncbi:hypothetical protein [Bradyrhizobium sp. RDM4]|uniref:hypothetical protein n=1 Tax=Bradyrhizobium sp. RDM4 TaxID=3378765 RepID=UPI0038FC6C1D